MQKKSGKILRIPNIWSTFAVQNCVFYVPKIGKHLNLVPQYLLF